MGFAHERIARAFGGVDAVALQPISAPGNSDADKGEYQRVEQRRQGQIRRGARYDKAEQRAPIRRIAPPDGAFYLYADMGEVTRDSLSFCRELLDATGVALNTGRDFDSVHGDRFVRISFAVSTPEVLRAIDCLDGFLRRRKRA